jgi:hypothetical protein
MKAFGFWWNWYDWSLSRREEHPDPESRGEFWLGMFALRCAVCRRWTLGCGSKDCQVFCGVCSECLPENWTDWENEPS